MATFGEDGRSLTTIPCLSNPNPGKIDDYIGEDGLPLDGLDPSSLEAESERQRQQIERTSGAMTTKSSVKIASPTFAPPM